MDPDALNYNPDATVNDFTCEFEPGPEEVEEEEEVIVVPEPEWDPPMPPEVPFLNSHGETLYVVTKEDVKNGNMVKLPSGVKIKATMALVKHITREQMQSSDIVLTEELKEVSVRKKARELLGGELPNDNPTAGTSQIAIFNNNLEVQSKELKRNPRGIIYIQDDIEPELKISLRSRAFQHDLYTRTIDTGFTKLLGKLE